MYVKEGWCDFARGSVLHLSPQRAVNSMSDLEKVE